MEIVQPEIIAAFRQDSLLCYGVAPDLQFSAVAIKWGQDGIITGEP
jgi:hypothetical protein